ncbi:MAG TPA: HepT-like ribonuclease domain-containing protein [Rhizomicrobium sp.]|nr:HepT-like ribonuclease domain-containing protein [Rhizomicrobium sp.]
MPFEARASALGDILHNIELATRFIHGLDRESFVRDLKSVYAVTRCLEIISEASRCLPDDLTARHPTIAWRQMAAAGNVYRHDYEDVSAIFVWETVAVALPRLREAVEQELPTQ